MTFDELFSAREWRAIPNCPGRFRLAPGSGRVSVEELVGAELEPKRYRVEGARDPVLVVPFPSGGGLISYEREDGFLVHTLNTPDGFGRKLGALGIAVG